MAGGQRVVDDLRDYYWLQDRYKPNRWVEAGLGSRRTHFWGQVAESVGGPHDTGSGVRVSIGDYRFRQKLYGGPIVAKNVTYLTIPIHPDAYARRAAEVFSLVGPLFCFVSKRGNLILAGRPEGKLTPYYLLKSSVYQKPDKDALPKDRWMGESFRSGVLAWFRAHSSN